MTRTGIWIGLLIASLGIAGCATTPSRVLEAFDACDRQAEACFDLCLLEESREAGEACDNSCDAEADQCFATVSRRGLRENPEWEPDSDYSFYGRTGEYSFRYGWQPGPHGQPYSYTRPEDRAYYDRRYYDPYFDNPNDCYGWRRARWCRNHDWYRDRYRDQYWPRPGRPRPRPDRPDMPQPDDPPEPVKPVVGDPRPDPRDLPVRRPDVEEPRISRPGDVIPERGEPFEPLIPPTGSDRRRPEATRPDPRPPRSQPQPVRRSEPVARPEPQPQRTQPTRRSQPQPQRTEPARPQPRRTEPPPPRRTEPARSQRPTSNDVGKNDD